MNKAMLPASTQYIDCQPFFDHHTGNNVDSFVDDLPLTVNVVPELSTWAFLLLSVCAVAGRRRTRLASDKLPSASDESTLA